MKSCSENLAFAGRTGVPAEVSAVPEPLRHPLTSPQEHFRLVRLCARLSGDAQAAEDLAQETLLEACRNAHNLRTPDAGRAWLHGIARNVCLRWQRRHAREMARRSVSASWSGLGAPGVEEHAAGAGDVARAEDAWAALERAERADLLSRALGSLPAATRSLLIARYVEDLPPSEIAARCRLSENVVSVRLHRGRAALRRVLSTRLRAEAAAYGLVETPSAGEPNATGGADAAQETRIWCPRCGAARLRGTFQRDTEQPHFRVWCPECRDALGADFSSEHSAFDGRQVLAGVRGFKPALRRVSAWWNRYVRDGIEQRHALCIACSRPAAMLTAPPDHLPPLLRDMRGIYLLCPSCQTAAGFSPSGLAFGSPQAQQFWRNHPRMRLLPERDLLFRNIPAVAACFESVSGRARCEVVMARDTFRVLTVLEGSA